MVAKLTSVYYSICSATLGIVFFGTPHQGGHLARVIKLFVKLARAVPRSPHNTFLSALKKGDHSATEILLNFRHIEHNYQYLSFYETSPLKCSGVVSEYFPQQIFLSANHFIKTVKKKSATLGLPLTREKRIPLKTDHEGICKFASEDSEDYKHVSELIVELVASNMGDQKEPSLTKSFKSRDTTLVDESPRTGHCNSTERSYGLTRY